MTLSQHLHSFRNSFDFALRQLLQFGREVKHAPEVHTRFQKELEAFFCLFDWNGSLPHQQRLRVLDIGARNFSLAPVFDSVFRGLGHEPEIHGIEIDAFRRLIDLRTRKDYGDFYAKQARCAQFHALDFLKWDLPADVIFALHPFVTPKPLLAWGLPLRHFRPEAFFAHAASLLSPEKGLLLVSNPTEEERRITQHLLSQDFELVETRDWKPGKRTVQGDPRLGGLYRRK